MPGADIFLLSFGAWEKIKWIILRKPYLSLLGLLIVSRMALILWGIKSISHYEELEQGYIAVEILSGMRARLIDFQVDEYTGGTLIMGVLAVPFFVLFGPTLFSLKLLALFISILSFSLLYFLIRRLWGEKVAVLVGLLWIFSPPLLYSTGLMALGSHERRLPLLLILFALLEYVSNPLRQKRFLALLGISWGIGMSISYINLIAVAACFLTMAMIRCYPKKTADWFLLVAAAIIGASYWIYYNMTHDWSGVRFLMDATIAGQGITAKEYGADFIQSMKNFSLHFFPNALSFQALGPIPGALMNYLYCGLLGFIVLPDMLRTLNGGSSIELHDKPHSWLLYRKAFKVFMGGYILLFPFFYFLSKNKIHSVEIDAFNYRYLIPFYTVIFLYAAVLMTEISRTRKNIFLLILFGAISQAQAVWAQPFGQVFQQPGFKSGLRYYIWHNAPDPGYINLAEFNRDAAKISPHILKRIANQDSFWLMGSPAELTHSIMLIKEECYRRYFYWRWASKLEIQYNQEDWVLIREIANVIPPEYRRDFFIGAAKRLNFSEWVRPADVAAFIENPQLPHKEIFYLYWGKSLYELFRNGYESRETFKHKMTYVANLSPETRTWIYRGMGMSTYRSFSYETILKMNYNFLSEWIPAEFLDEVYWGVGWYLGRRYFENPEKAAFRISKLEAKHQGKALQGFHAFSLKEVLAPGERKNG